MAVSTISKTVSDFTGSLHEKFMPKRWEAITSGFYRKANILRRIGAADGKHVRIIKPQHTDSMSLSYKDYFSIALLAVANS
jgi:hypothetical protein